MFSDWCWEVRYDVIAQDETGARGVLVKCYLPALVSCLILERILGELSLGP